MQTTEIAVCNIGLFGDSIKNFWIDDVIGLLEKFPILEFPHKQNFYSLLIIETAEGEIMIDNQKIRLDQAKAIIIKPGCISSIDINRQAKGKIICFTEEFFSLRYNDNVLTQFSFLQREAEFFIRLNSIQLNRFRALLELIKDEFKNEKKRKTKSITFLSEHNIIRTGTSKQP